MDYKQAQELVAEYQALPDLDSRLLWAGYAMLPQAVFTCVCGDRRTFLVDMGELIRMVERGPARFKLLFHSDRCWGHDEEGDGEEEEETEAQRR